MSTLIHLESSKGQEMLDDCIASKEGSVFQPVIHAVFNKQVAPASCGIQTSAIILAAQQLGKNHVADSVRNMPAIPKSEQPITEETMFDYEGTTKVVSRDVIKNAGMTLEQVSNVLKGHGKTVTTVFASDADVSTFREDAKKALSALDSSSSACVNYHMETLGQEPPYGHHSPLAAYHAPTDRFLIMDTWYTTKECWAEAETLFKAMDTIDSDSNKTRGYCIVN